MMRRRLVKIFCIIYLACILIAQPLEVIHQPKSHQYKYFYDNKKQSVCLKTPGNIYDIWKIDINKIQIFEVLTRIKNIDYIYKLEFERGHGEYEFCIVDLVSGNSKNLYLKTNDYLGKIDQKILFFLGGVDINDQIQEGVIAIKIPSLKRIVLAPELIVDKNSVKIENGILSFSGNDSNGNIAKRKYSINVDF